MTMTTFELTEAQRVLTNTPRAVRDVLAYASENAISYREAPRAWTVHEVLCHLAEGEISDWIPRVRIILAAGEDRTFEPFNREGGLTRFRGWSSIEVLDEFERLRLARRPPLDRSTAMREAFYLWTDVHSGRASVVPGKKKI